MSIPQALNAAAHAAIWRLRKCCLAPVFVWLEISVQTQRFQSQPRNLRCSADSSPLCLDPANTLNTTFIYPLWWDCYLFFHHLCGFFNGKITWKLRGSAHSLRPPELAQRLMHVQERAAALETCQLQMVFLGWGSEARPALALNILVSDLSTMRI